MDRYERRVRAGASILDNMEAMGEEKLQDWRNKIDVGAISMLSDRLCIWGQLYGNFSAAPNGIGRREHTLFNILNGFAPPLHWWDMDRFPGSVDRYLARAWRLKEAWQQYIRSTRREKAPV